MSVTAIADGSVQEEHGLDEGYLAWAVNDMGVIVHHPLRVGSMPGREERGVFCQQDIPAESIVVSVPWEALMTVESAEGTPFEGLLGQPEEQAGGISREDDLLCLLLLYHKHVLAERSPFWKHMQALPREYHQTIHYTEEELQLLKGTSLHALTVHWKAQVESDFRELERVELCGQGGADASTVRDALGGNLTEEAYLWALSTVWSRFVSIQRGGRLFKVMAPAFDMFNHDPQSSTVHGFQEANDCLHLVTLQEWTAGSEVRFCYGPLPNSRLLLLHGFCVPGNPFDAVELWCAMEETAPGYADKAKILARNGVDPKATPFVLTAKGLDPKVLPALRIQRATESELKIAAEAAWGQPLSERNEAEVCDVLSAALAAMLEERRSPPVHKHCNGPCRKENDSTDVSTETGGEFGEERDAAEVDGGAAGGVRWVMPENRRKAVELVKEGEERVLRLCLDQVEAHRAQVNRQLE